MTARSRSTRPLSGIVLAALGFLALHVLGGAPLSAQAFQVTLKNGNTFVSKYEPVDASYDPSKMIIVTEVGNRIALAKDDVEHVTADLENRGFGVIIDTTTIAVGVTANDLPEGEAGEGDPTLTQLATPSPYMPTVFPGSFTTPGFPSGGFGATGGAAEPSEPGGFGAGIPLSFVGGVAPVVPVQPPN